MNPSRILFIAHDTLLATCYGEALAKAGFHVSVARDGESGLARLKEIEPAAVVLDLLLPKMSSTEVITQIRGNKPTRHLPIIALPTELEQLAQAAHVAGVTKHLERFANPIATLINAIEGTLNTQGNAPKSLPQHISAESLQRCGAEIVTRVGSLRRSLQNCTQKINPDLVFRELLLEVHHFSEVTGLLGWKPVFQMALALEALVFDLERMPEQATASTLRTVSQGVDFLATLVAEERWTRLKAPDECQVLVVEDDVNARHLITAAMQMVSLAATSSATPEASLKIVDQTPFDLIFLDVGLPEMTGFDLCTKIRAIPIHKETPVVFLTGMATFQNRVQSSLCGGNDFIGKPFNLPELGVKALLWVFKGQLTAARPCPA